jgi:hypothetical protein
LKEADIERQDLLDVSQNNPLLYYCELEHKLYKDNYIYGSKRDEISGIVWLKAGIWKLWWIGRGLESGRCLVCLGEEDANHINRLRNGKLKTRSFMY